MLFLWGYRSVNSAKMFTGLVGDLKGVSFLAGGALFLVMDKHTFCFASLQQSQTEQDVENKYFDNYSDMVEYATNRLPDESDGVWVVDVNNDENRKRSYFITNDLDEIKHYISSATPATKMTIFEWEDYETCGQSMCDLAEGLTDNVWDLKNVTIRIVFIN